MSGYEEEQDTMRDERLDDGYMIVLFWAFCISFGALMGYFLGMLA